MTALRTVVLAQALLLALSAPSAAGRRARHVEPPPEDPDDGDEDVVVVDAPEAPPARPRVTAAVPARDAGWHAGIAVGADIPLDALHVGLVIQAPSGLRLSSSVGVLADTFLGSIDAPGGGPAATALMHQALRDAIVWRTHLGWKPWRNHGFYAAVGYGMCSFAVAATAGDVVSVAIDQMLPLGLGSSQMVHATSTLHTVDLEAGWEWAIARHFTFRTAVSAATVVASSTSLHIDGAALASTLPSIDQLIPSIERGGAAALDAMYKDVGPIVMLTVQLQLDLL